MRSLVLKVQKTVKHWLEPPDDYPKPLNELDIRPYWEDWEREKNGNAK